jgi:hypothetical protein
MKVVLTIAALANYGVTVWHAYLAKRVNPALPAAEAVRIAAIAGALTLVGVALLWRGQQMIGSLVLIAVFVVGLVIGSAEHFLVAGPNNVFNVGNGDWAVPFKISAWALLVLEVAGLSAAGRMLAARS